MPGLRLFCAVPSFEPPKPPEHVVGSLPWLTGLLADEHGLKVWLENQKVESRLLCSSHLCHFVLRIAVYDER